MLEKGIFASYYLDKTGNEVTINTANTTEVEFVYF